MDWYSQQTLNFKWDNVLSESFHVSNGLRQDGIQSPHIFKLYINKLCYKLNICNAGCNFNDEMINNIAYAGDLSLLSLSPKGLQKLSDICEEYEKKTTTSYLILKRVCASYLILKRVCACVLQEKLGKLISHRLALTINGNILQFEHKANYINTLVLL